VATGKGICHIQGIAKSNAGSTIGTKSLTLKVFDFGDQKSLEVVAVPHHLVDWVRGKSEKEKALSSLR
jgi:hypothetical protein